jgi:DNA replication protein DnaC
VAEVITPKRRLLVTGDLITTVQGRAFFAERTEKYFNTCKTCNGTCEVMARNENLEHGWRNQGKEVTEPIMTPVGCPDCRRYASRMEYFSQKFFLAVPPRYQGCIFSQLEPSPKSRVPLQRQQEIMDDLRAQSDQSVAFFGPPGTSKTTWMTAMYAQMCWWESGQSLATTGSLVYRYTTKALLEQFTQWQTRTGKEDEFIPAPRMSRERIEKVSRLGAKMHLFLEEIDKVKLTDSRVGNLFEVVDALYENMGQLVINSNLTPEEFQSQFGSEFARRISEMCKVVNLF